MGHRICSAADADALRSAALYNWRCVAHCSGHVWTRAQRRQTVAPCRSRHPTVWNHENRGPDDAGLVLPSTRRPYPDARSSDCAAAPDGACRPDCQAARPGYGNPGVLIRLFVSYLAGLSFRWIVPVFLAFALAVGALITFETKICQPDVQWPLLHDYQKHRVCTLLNPGADPLGKGFHTLQATIAIGSGGLHGKGWLKGTQTHLEFIPEKHTDFIFSVYAEEFGLIGGLALLALYFCLIVRGLQVAARGATLFGRLLAGSLILTLFSDVFVNIGMNSGLLPIVGAPLPLMSYGGTALVTVGIAVGLIMSVGRRKPLIQS